MDARLSIDHQRSDRMWTGIVDSIYIAERAKQPTKAVPEVKAIPGVGLDGDRYARKQGTFYKPEPDFELTLIEAEAIEALKREYKVELSLAEARRNGNPCAAIRIVFQRLDHIVILVCHHVGAPQVIGMHIAGLS